MTFLPISATEEPEQTIDLGDSMDATQPQGDFNNAANIPGHQQVASDISSSSSSNPPLQVPQTKVGTAVRLETTQQAAATEQLLLIKELLNMNMAFWNANTNNEAECSKDVSEFRDKQKINSFVEGKGKQVLESKEIEVPYTVELPEEDTATQENDVPQPMEGDWELELTHSIINTLCIKRKKEDQTQLLIEDSNKTPENEGEHQG
ncbi:hypothetical protein PIB30_009669 [Stylosanthes scabra]|uniref:Uncharacterized protein n=1 Tax=Stylosanthes scabra TaxID=79078 RepID=A0ABU6U5G8_9FABA|nr:hypothetical protein [Stylosanthes scabra]